MKAFTILLCFSFILFELNAQNDVEFELRWGPEAELLRQTEMETLLSIDEDFIYVVAVSRRVLSSKRYVLKYDRKTLEIVEQTEVAMIEGRNVYEFNVVLDDQLYFFTSETIRQNRITTLSYRKFNLEAMQLDGEYVKVMEARPKKQDALFVIGSAGDEFDFALSRNKNQLLIYNIPDKRDRENFEVQFKLFDSNMESIWESVTEVPYETRHMRTARVIFGDVGEIYLICSVETGDRARRGEGANYFYTMLNISKDGQSYDELKIDTQKKFVRGCVYRFNYHTGALIMVCNYGETFMSGSNGILINTINVGDFTARNQLLYEFDVDFLSHFVHERRLRRGNGIEDLGLDYIAVHDDGSYSISGEVRRNTARQREGSMLTSMEFLRKEIIVMQLSPDFEVNWLKHIAKKQGSVNDNAIRIGYFALYNDDFISYFFNDWEENEHVFDADELFMRLSGPTDLMNVVVGRDGSMSKKLIESITDKGESILPDTGSVHRTSNGEFILFGRNQELFRLGFLSEK